MPARAHSLRASAHRLAPICAAFAAVMLAAAPPARAAITGLQRLAFNLTQPVYVTDAPGDRNRLFIVTKPGDILIYDLANRQLQATPFLDIADTDAAANESGLLGLAFHPDYANNGKFYVNVTVDNGGVIVDGLVSPFTTHIREYTVSANPDVANSTFSTVLSYVQPQENHNGGWIGFGPGDGNLYVMSGDGGGGNDVGAGHAPELGNAQDTTDNLLGKVLRIDVDGDDFPADPDRNYAIPAGNPFVGVAGDDEIWAYGLRNPWRASFDRATHDLWIGDVGQQAYEEIDVIPAGQPGGANFGWRLREGTEPTPTGGVGGPAPPGAVEPVYTAPHAATPQQSSDFVAFAIIGGYVYRGPDPSLRGKYVFADASTTRFWTFDPADPWGTVANINSQLPRDAGVGGQPGSFGEDADGNLYVAFVATGEVFRIATNALTPGDFDADAVVGAADLDLWTAGFGLTAAAAPADGDADGDADVDGADFLAWQRHLGASALTPAASVSRPVPEPLPAGLLGIGTIVVASRRRKP